MRENVALPRSGDGGVLDHLRGGGDVLEEVNQDGSRTPGRRDDERFPHNGHDFFRVAHKEGCLCNRHGDSGNVHLLKGVAAQQGFPDVAGNKDHGRRI